MYLKQKSVILISVLILLTTACSQYQKVLKSNDYELKYVKAKEYYNKNDYYRALPLFEELVNVFKGTDRAEDLYYYYAYCHFGLGDYLTAMYHFKNFAATFKNSERKEECQYMHAYCFYLTSPNYSLDQSNTLKAIESFQLFINLYPESKRIMECNKYMDALRNKLETKAFENAKLYYNIGDFKSAIIALENSTNEYPDIVYREEIEFLVLKANYQLAENSIDSKKPERFELTIKAYNQFIDHFPNSSKLNEAENLYELSLKNLNKS